MLFVFLSITSCNSWSFVSPDMVCFCLSREYYTCWRSLPRRISICSANSALPGAVLRLYRSLGDQIRENSCYIPDGRNPPLRHKLLLFRSGPQPGMTSSPVMGLLFPALTSCSECKYKASVNLRLLCNLQSFAFA